MIHVTVGITQFFVILVTQMAIVVLGLIAVGVVALAGMLIVWRRVARRRQTPEREPDR